MKRYAKLQIQILLVFLLLNINSYPNELLNLFPTLYEQIKNNTNDAFTPNNALQAINKYIDTSNIDFIKGMGMILQEDIYNYYKYLQNNDFRIDGNMNKWKKIKHEPYDRHFELSSNAFLKTSLKAFIDKNGDIFLLVKSGIDRVWVHQLNNNRMIIDVRVYRNKPFVNVYDKITDKVKRYYLTEIKWMGEYTEIKIPLKRIIDENYFPLNKEFSISAKLKDNQGKNYWERIRVYGFDKKNHALYLLIYMLQNNIYIPNDTITLALALANNKFYYIGNDEVKKQVKIDLKRHFHFYQKVIQWQKKWLIDYNLSRAKLIPKLFWANRENRIKMVNSTLSEYLELIDRVELLEHLHDNVILQSGIENINRLKELSKFVELKIQLGTLNEIPYSQNVINIVFPGQHRQDTIENLHHAYLEIKKHPDLLRKKKGDFLKLFIKLYEKGVYKKITDITLNGRKLKNANFEWFNRQYLLSQEFGGIFGDCRVSSTVIIRKYIAAGIPATRLLTAIYSMQSTSGHRYPMYYNVSEDRWDSVQMQSERENEYNRTIRAVFYIFRLHHYLVDKDYYSEIQHYSRIVREVKKGIAGVKVEKYVIPYLNGPGDVVFQ